MYRERQKGERGCSIRNGVTLISIMVSPSTKFALNKRTLENNPFQLVRMNSIR